MAPTPPTPPLPVLLRVAGRRCVVVGGGPVGLRRARRLAAAGADVTVVDPRPGPELVQMAGPGPDGGSVEVVPREVEPEDLEGAAVVVAATDSAEVNAAVAGAARRAGALVNRADDAGAGDLLWPAVTTSGPLCLAVSTGGAAPGVSAWAAERLAGSLGDTLELDATGLGLLVELVEETRAELRAAAHAEIDVTPGSVDWHAVLDRTMLDLICRGRRAEAKERLLACLSSS